MKWQTIFSGENKKYLKVLSAEIFTQHAIKEMMSLYYTVS